MQTIRIFDEFPETMGEITNERKHLKRQRLEPLIFDILQRKYLGMLIEAWKKDQIPKNTNKCVVLVERRIHENLFFLLRNIAYYAKGWSVCIVCSDINIEYCKEISEHNKDNITFLQLFKGNPDSKAAKEEYNYLLQDANFYEQLTSENILFMETDTYLRICDTIKEKNTNQDVYICEGVNKLGYKMPEFMKGITYFAESCFYEDPVGVHQWWTFFTKDLEDAEYIFDCFCSFVI